MHDENNEPIGPGPSPLGGGGAKVLTIIEERSPSLVSTTSGTFVDLAVSASIKFTGKPVLFMMDGSALPATAAVVSEFAIQIDSGPDNLLTKMAFITVDEHHAVHGLIILTPTAGNHVIKLRWRRTQGTGTLTRDGNDSTLLYAVET